MFSWGDNATVPRLSDVLNGSENPPNMLRLFTYPWVFYFGGWFFAFLIGALGGALYVKTNNVIPSVVLFIVFLIFFGEVLAAEPYGAMPSADVFVTVIGIFCSFAVGFVFYRLYVGREE